MRLNDRQAHVRVPVMQGCSLAQSLVLAWTDTTVKDLAPGTGALRMVSCALQMLLPVFWPTKLEKLGYRPGLR